MTLTVAPTVDDEAAAKQLAWRLATETKQHQIIVARGPVFVIKPLPSLVIAAGDVVISLVSPSSQEPRP